MTEKWSAEEYFKEIKLLVQKFCNSKPIWGTFEDYLDNAKEIREIWQFSKELIKENKKEELSKLYEMALDKFFSA